RLPHEPPLFDADAALARKRMWWALAVFGVVVLIMTTAKCTESGAPAAIVLPEAAR
nr:hypothetical protein [Deltaproteobacteria bacterium]